ncbi:hypothetical protein ACERK3_07455 [Phycisphaerales bacterium AB-hyl4]|uniref:Porin n=1 Tax=Natronomicrosphaera hydrolytica TaxID=3242702 RepID=A0ABV4U784_9BACT
MTLTTPGKWTAMLVTGALGAGLLATPGQAQDDYVPRAEHEQLRADMETLRLRLDGVEQQAEQPAAPAEARQRDGFMLDTGDFKPGWERVRYDGWMEHGKLDEMSVQIGRGGPIDLYMGLQTAGRLQYLQQRNVEINGVGQRGSLSPGFQTAWGSVDFLADLYDGGLEVYFDLYLSSPTSADKLQGHEGYMIMRHIPGTEGTLLGNLFEVVNVKAGQFEIDFGDNRYRRTDNARSQRNILIGNHVVDPKTTEIGMEVFNAEPDVFNWLVGFGSGSETGGFDPGRGFSTHGKLWANLGDLRVAGSAYYVDHASDTGVRSNLFRTSRGGGVYQGVLTGDSPGQVFAGGGQSVLAFQGDLTWILNDLELYGNVGWVRDDANAGGRDEWLYYGVEGAYYLTPRMHLAARYSGAAAQRLAGESSSGLVHRGQIGGGYWLYDTVLVKAEYVHQLYDGFSTGQRVSGVDAWNDPSFTGFMMEVSFGF